MKILSNKKYNELILKSCKGMFGAVTDDMLLRENALLNEENKQLKEKINKAINDLDKLNIKLKEILSTGINIKEISDIKEILIIANDEGGNNESSV